MTEASDSRADRGDDAGALLSRLHLIEDQTLDQRATAFAQVHDALQRTLDSGDSTRIHG